MNKLLTTLLALSLAASVGLSGPALAEGRFHLPHPIKKLRERRSERHTSPGESTMEADPEGCPDCETGGPTCPDGTCTSIPSTGAVYNQLPQGFGDFTLVTPPEEQATLPAQVLQGQAPAPVLPNLTGVVPSSLPAQNPQVPAEQVVFPFKPRTTGASNLIQPSLVRVQIIGTTGQVLTYQDIKIEPIALPN